MEPIKASFLARPVFRVSFSLIWQFWLVTHYVDVAAMLKDERVSRVSKHPQAGPSTSSPITPCPFRSPSLRSFWASRLKTATASTYWSAEPCQSELPRGASSIFRARARISGSCAISGSSSLSAGCGRVDHHLRQFGLYALQAAKRGGAFRAKVGECVQE